MFQQLLLATVYSKEYQATDYNQHCTTEKYCEQWKKQTATSNIRLQITFTTSYMQQAIYNNKLQSATYNKKMETSNELKQ